MEPRCRASLSPYGGDAMALDHSCQVQRCPRSERGRDLYEMPAAATQDHDRALTAASKRGV